MNAPADIKMLISFHETNPSEGIVGSKMVLLASKSHIVALAGYPKRP
jgi:hypothetical protein